MPQESTSRILLIFLSLTLTWAPLTYASERFIRLNDQGEPIASQTSPYSKAWPCVLDQKTGLIWEVKTQIPGLHYRDNTYSWFNPDQHNNGGLAGYPGGVSCHTLPCDTGSLLDAVNRIGWCNAHDWRLPTREELRSLVNYAQHGNGPAVDTSAFPNTATQFYWSADPNATNPDEAWGVGFAFGFDYAYYKQNRVHVRLVRQKKLIAKNGIH